MAKKPAPQDWHKADIIAAVHRRGTTLRQLAMDNGYSYQSTAAQAFHRPYPKLERIIAEFLGIPPQQIWPSRYHADGTPKSGRGERGLGRHKPKFNASSAGGKVNLTGGL